MPAQSAVGMFQERASLKVGLVVAVIGRVTNALEAGLGSNGCCPGALGLELDVWNAAKGDSKGAA